MINVAILVDSQLSPFEFGCASELFLLSRPEFKHWYTAEVVSLSTKAIHHESGLSINAKKIASFAAYHMVVIPGWSTTKSKLTNKLKSALIDFSAQGGRLVSFCSGAFLLAEAGLLTDRNATTHWRYSESFQQRFPHVIVNNDVLYTHSDNIYCSAGSAAALDLGLAIIKQDFGARIANKVAKRLVISAHRTGGQSQYVETPVSIRHEKFASVLDWAILHLQQGVTVEDLAKQTHMSRRSFDRHFHQKMGITPKLWLIKQQLHLAKGLLETRHLTIDEVADKAGFKSSLNLRHHFNKVLGISPSKYRSQFSFND